MSRIIIVTDSTADIPKSAQNQYGIEIVPLKLQFGSETFLDNVTMNAEQFYLKLADSRELPTTSQPSPIEFSDMYQRILLDYPEAEIISIHLASKLSGTYQSAMIAKTLIDNNDHITIVDSKSASYGLGMLAVAAAEAANQGKSKEECLELIDAIRNETKLYFFVDTLEYLQKGGRIGRAAAFVGALLNIKPILSIDLEGNVTAVDKVRGQRNAMSRIAEMLKQEFGDRKVHATFAHSNALKSAEELAAIVGFSLNIIEISFTSIGPVVGTHAGPGAAAVFMRPAYD